MKRFAIVLLTLLTACSSVEDDLTTFMKCGIAANELDETKASINVSEKLKKYAEEHHLQGSASEAMFLGEKVRNEEFKLYEKSSEGKFYTLAKAYN